MNYQQTLQYLYHRFPAFQKIGSDAYKPGLKRVSTLLKYLDNPYEKYKIIHVGGTNGKGSVSHFMASILQSAGYKTGLYTSPHLVDFGERIRINGEMIKEKYVVDFVRKYKSLIEEIDTSFFEATMAMAFCYFADCNVDVVVVEVGLGGRLDSTNVVLPQLSIITNIGYDHTQFLGNTLSEIAKEKAGIIKKNIPIVVGERNNKTDCVFVEKSEKEQCELTFAEDIDFHFINKNNLFSIRIGETKITPELQSAYQQKNIRTVLVSIGVLRNNGFQISDKAIQWGLENVIQNTHFQGRWQTLQNTPKIIIDTAHNPHGMQSVVSELEKEEYNKLLILFGMVKDKEVEKVLDLLPRKADYFFTTLQTERTIEAETLKKQADKKGFVGKAYSSSEKAFKIILSKANKDDLILILGSNYLVGEILAFVKT